MTELANILILLTAFSFVSLASKDIGRLFVRFNLPLISGFLLAGIVAGPFVLKLIPQSGLSQLRFVDEVSLAFIAFAAGSELYLKELRSRLRSIKWITLTLVVSTFALGVVTMLALARSVPFMSGMSTAGHLAVGLLVAAILVARSPSSAIAIINELKAKGPFTQTLMGVTVIKDVVVILLFALSTEIADALLAQVSLSLNFVLLLGAEFLLSLLVGLLLGLLIQRILAFHVASQAKVAGILLAGYAVFFASGRLRTFSHDNLPVELLLEPLLICMIAGFMVANNSSYRAEFLKILHDTGPTIYVLFFTLTGASLALDVLAQTWRIALILFLVRLVSIVVGAYTGGVLAGEPRAYNRVSWMVYLTQAGVGLGLAKEVAVEFPDFGPALATTVISVIVLNQLVGPPFFKWAIRRVGEAHTGAEPLPFDGVRDALIFGLENQSVALARQLRNHGWQVEMVSLQPEQSGDSLQAAGIRLAHLPDLSPASLQSLGMEKADAVVALLSDEENEQIGSYAFHQLGVETMVVRLNDRANWGRFHALGALIVDPGTAIVSLLDHMVRSPAAASLLLGLEEGQDVLEVELRNHDLAGLALRDLRLPLDTLVISIQRHGQQIISHGYTRLQANDHVTLVGSPDSLERVRLNFEA